VAIGQLAKLPESMREASADCIADLVGDEDVNVRRAVMTQMGVARTPKAVAAAIRGLDDADKEVVALSLKLLAQYKDESAVMPLANHYATIGEPVLATLAAYGGECKEKVAEAYRTIMNGAGDTALKSRILVLLIQADPDGAGPLLLPLITDGEAAIRALAMSQLASIKYAPAVPQVADRLREDPEAATKALVAYGSVAERGAAEKLQDGDPKVRMLSLAVLMQIGTRQSLAAVQAAAKDPQDLRVALEARDVWRKIDPGALSPLDEALMDLDGAAGAAAGGAGSKDLVTRAVQALKGMQPDESRRDAVAKKLFDAITGTGPAGAGSAAAFTEPAVQQMACDALINWADKTVKDQVIEHLKLDTEDSKRSSLIKLAVAFKDARAVRPLCESLAQGRNTREVLDALYEFGPASEEYLIRLLATNDATMQANCCDLLRDIGTRRCFRALTAISTNKSGDPKMRQMALQTLIQINRRLNTAAYRAAAAAREAGTGGGGTTTTSSTTRPAAPKKLWHPATLPSGPSFW
jgi:HEAT repeat protein